MQVNLMRTLVGGLTLSALVAGGGDLYWDTNGTTPGFGAASGIWGSSAYWSTDPTGASETSAQTTTGGDALYFGTETTPLGGGTIAVDAQQEMAYGRVFVPDGEALNFQGDGGLVIPDGTTAGEVRTYQGSGNATFLKKGVDTLLFENLDLSTFRPTVAWFNKGGRSGSWASGEAGVFFVDWTEETATMTFQCQRQSGVYWICQKIQLKQSGEGVVGRVVYNRYKEVSGMMGSDYDFVSGYTDVDVCALKTDGKLSDGYLIDYFEMTDSYDGERGWFVGGGGRAVVDTPMTVQGDFNVVSSLSSEYIGNTAAKSMKENADVVVFRNLKLSSYEPDASYFNKMGRSNSWASGPAAVRYLVRSADGNEISFQCQLPGSVNLMCVKVRLTQSGDDVLGRIVYARYIANSKAKNGFDFDNQTGWTKADVAVVSADNNSAFSKGGYLVDWLRLVYVGRTDQYGSTEFRRPLTVGGWTTVAPYQEVCLLHEDALAADGEIAASIMNNGRIVFGLPCQNYVIRSVIHGDGTYLFTNRQAVVSVAAANVLDAGEVIADGCTMSLDLVNVNYDNPGVLSPGKVLRVTNGGRLLLNGGYCINRKDGSGIELDASTAVCRQNLYLNRVALKNGSTVEGPAYVSVGLTASDWTVGGTSPSAVNTDLQIVGGDWVTSGPWPSVTFDVADVTGDAGVDFSVNGCIRRFTADNNHMGIFLDKRGDGTMRIVRTDVTNLTCRIYAGTLLLGSNDVFAATNLLRLNGGTLAVAPKAVTSAGRLTLDADSTIEIGANAQLTFADASKLSWTAGKTLTVKGTLGRRSLRFGTSSAGLTADQLAAIRDENGEPCRIDADGYVRSSKTKGLVIFLGSAL